MMQQMVVVPLKSSLFKRHPNSPFLWLPIGKVSVVRLLKDPRVDVTLEDINGCTPLWYASRYGEHEEIEWFIASCRDLGDIKVKKAKWGGKDFTALKHREVVPVLERFVANPALTRQEIRQKLNFTGLFLFPFPFSFSFLVLSDIFSFSFQNRNLT